MFNAQFVRLASAVIKSLPYGTADHALNAMAEAEITFGVEETRNRLESEAHQVLHYVREGGGGYHPDPRD